MPLTRRDAFTLAALCAGVALMGLPDAAFAQGLPRADGARTPVKLYGPQTGCPKTMIVSHGLGGSEEGLAGFATAMGAAGWRVIVMGHAESGRALLRQALTGGIARGEMRAGIRDAAGDPAHHRARMLDLDATFALATRGCRPPQLVLAGHSMGAMTTMFEAGATPRFGRLGANRFDAYVALSPQGVGHVFAEGAWRAVTRPVLMVTGTRDEGTDGDWRTRLSAFEGLPPGLKRLVVIPGATHMDVGGKEAREGATLAALTQEFLAGVQAGKLGPSAVRGVDIRDK